MLPITVKTLQTVLPKCKNPQDWVTALNPALVKFEINSNARIASFLALGFSLIGIGWLYSRQLKINSN